MSRLLPDPAQLFGQNEHAGAPAHEGRPGGTPKPARAGPPGGKGGHPYPTAPASLLDKTTAQPALLDKEVLLDTTADETNGGIDPTRPNSRHRPLKSLTGTEPRVPLSKIPAVEALPAVRSTTIADPSDPQDRGRIAKEAQRQAAIARARLTGRFVEDLQDMWAKDGPSILGRAAFQNPLGFAKMVADLLPKQLDVQTSQVTELDDERLGQLIDILSARLGDGAASAARTIEGRAVETLDPEPIVDIPAVPEAAGVPPRGRT